MARSGRFAADELLATAMASGKTVTSSAEVAGVSVQTAWRRLRNPKFKARVVQIRAAMLDRAQGALADGLQASTDVLRRLLDSESEKVALRAALAHLQEVVRLRDATTLEQRITELERARAAVEESLAKGVAGGPVALPLPEVDDGDELEDQGEEA